MPVAVPLVARPALLIAGLSVVADHGVPFHVAVLAIGVVAIVAATAGRPADEAAPGVALWTWSSRLLSCVAVVAGILLIADAVFDI